MAWKEKLFGENTPGLHTEHRFSVLFPLLTLLQKSREERSECGQKCRSVMLPALLAGSEFGTVDYEAIRPGGAHFYLDFASTTSLFIGIFMVIAFVVGHAASAHRSPALFASQDEYFPFNQTSDTSVTIEIRVDSIEPLHRFLAVNCSLIG
jgi:hypothetical protein